MTESDAGEVPLGAKVQVVCRTCDVELTLPGGDPATLAVGLAQFFAEHETHQTTMDLGGATLPSAPAPVPDVAPERPRRGLLRQVAGLRRRAGPAATVGPPRSELELRLLGGLTVLRSGEPLGTESQRLLLAYLVVRGGAATVTELAPVMGEGLDEALGRLDAERLVVRREEGVSLPAGARSDVASFLVDVDLVLGARDDALQLGRRAVARYAGELLPGHRHVDWTTAPRERLRGRYLALLDRMADLAAAHGGVDEALSWYERALEVEPHDEQRYIATARLLVEHGRTGAAARVVQRALAMLERLGVGPSAELSALADRVGA